MDIPGEKLPADLPGYLRDTVSPEVPEAMRAAFLESVGNGTHIRTMQNKQLYSTPLHQPGGPAGHCVGGVGVPSGPHRGALGQAHTSVGLGGQILSGVYYRIYSHCTLVSLPLL